jgi:deoxyhypusine monooxygenase
MRAAYFAKQMFSDNKDDAEKTEAILKVLGTQVMNKAHGSLLRHEFAYVLGQMQTPRACQILEKLLQKKDDCVMVRHEAAEALGAIGSPGSVKVLKEVYKDFTGNLDELADTCKLAYNRIEQQQNPDEADSIAVGCACMLAPYNSVDPADADPKHEGLSTKDLGNLLLDSSQDLLERYRAMFSLRNRGGENAVLELCRALVEDKSSPLLRHEVAFVLGQMQHPCSIDALETSLARVEEHVMVRHESAEALGAIDVSSSEEWNRIESILKHYQQDSKPEVAESCIVALDAADYWGHANTTEEEEEDNEVVPDPSVDPVDMRKHVLDQHFNVQATA